MGNGFNPLNPVDPFDVGTDPMNPGHLFHGGDFSKGAIADSKGAIGKPPDVSKLFQPYDKYIPEAMSTGGQINDPNAILAAYRMHLPEFMNASGANTAAPVKGSSLSEKKQGK